MPFPVESLIEGRPFPLTISKDDSVIRALNLMIENDYSQLPVVSDDKRPLGMITYEGILQGVRNFHVGLSELHVRDVISAAKMFNMEDDLFDLLEELKRTYAVLIGDAEGCLAGIVTSYDSTEYFRGRSEDLMLVEDIEVMVKELVLLAYMDGNDDLDKERLSKAIAGVTMQTKGEGGSKQLDFDQLSLGQYITLLVSKNTWSFFEPVFRLPRDSVRKFLEEIRETRNSLAHFRGEISVTQTKQLHWCNDWLTRCREAYDQAKNQTVFRQLVQLHDPGSQVPLVLIEPGAASATGATMREDNDLRSEGFDEVVPVIAEESSPRDSRYTPLADWLQSQPGKIDSVKLTFAEIEAIIGGDLPASAHDHRAWWANDVQGHPHSRLWLDAGWRTSGLNMTQKRVSFSRIREREKAYIDFFSGLLTELRQRANFPVKDSSPDGASWVVCQTISTPGYIVGQFVYSFARGQRFRTELYIDTNEQATTKAVFDRIHAHKFDLENQIGALQWERIDDKRASRIARYQAGSIADDEVKLAALRNWAVDSMITFYNAIEPVASQAFRGVLLS